jgi:hypothetical protein
VSSELQNEYLQHQIGPKKIKKKIMQLQGPLNWKEEKLKSFWNFNTLPYLITINQVKCLFKIASLVKS